MVTVKCTAVVFLGINAFVLDLRNLADNVYPFLTTSVRFVTRRLLQPSALRDYQAPLQVTPSIVKKTFPIIPVHMASPVLPNVKLPSVLQLSFSLRVSFVRSEGRVIDSDTLLVLLTNVALLA